MTFTLYIHDSSLSLSSILYEIEIYLKELESIGAFTDELCIPVLMMATSCHAWSTGVGVVLWQHWKVVLFFSNLTVVQKLERDKASRRSMRFSLLASSSPYTGGFPAAVMSAGESVAGSPWHSWQPHAGTEESGSTLLNGKCPPCLLNHWSSLNLLCKILCCCCFLNQGWEFKSLLQTLLQIPEISLS